LRRSIKRQPPHFCVLIGRGEMDVRARSPLPDRPHCSRSGRLAAGPGGLRRPARRQMGAQPKMSITERPLDACQAVFSEWVPLAWLALTMAGAIFCSIFIFNRQKLKIVFLAGLRSTISKHLQSSSLITRCIPQALHGAFAWSLNLHAIDRHAGGIQCVAVGSCMPPPSRRLMTDSLRVSSTLCHGPMLFDLCQRARGQSIRVPKSDRFRSEHG
jgi:hypothetical protein